jgi:hypothetical protein
MWHVQVNSIEMHPGCTLRAMTRSLWGVMIGAGEGTRYTRCAHMMDLTLGGPATRWHHTSMARVLAELARSMLSGSC